MPSAVKTIQLIECPRDAMQGWPHPIPTEKKINYINQLLQVGFHTIDFGSFVSPKAIPQMADTVQVLKGLHFNNSITKLLAIVANVRGAEAAVLFDEITYLGFPFSVSPTFQMRNTNSTQEESVQTIETIQELCIKNNKQLVVYLSMGFGNPYGDVYNSEILLQWADAMIQKDITIISLADTVGLAAPIQISEVFQALIPAYPHIIFGAHLHASPDNRIAKLAAAYHAGCMRFDGALRGYGGCPMAQNELVGNMDSLSIIDYFSKEGLSFHFNANALENSVLLAGEIFS
ncbi:MAG: hydroxymethylglutaryl-CoA lyase [Hydrotalea flava]|uniref:hydroxymethylglutaryl-CoA lyase n=1 Tax=Hydrotalea TaxID=1004300 RepID=UPI000945BDBE|nr:MULTISPECIES: hydroxymethylglutaryl-CoA lyase [Hydrotalea]MBY0347354.1 hydroxymethylglutaryl-CoA lyase [Hydrotalea flava]RWZ87938.1 MAG: hydroxymethylglutaryl-CoA lyase [Hydrotalea sp. AMD]